jgi:hypothetical protein
MPKLDEHGNIVEEESESKEGNQARRFLRSKVGQYYQPSDLAAEFELIKELRDVTWEDITNQPDLGNMVATLSDHSRPAIMLNEGVFKAGRLYAPSYKPNPILTEFQDLARNLASGNMALQSSTGKVRNKELHYVSMTCWADAARTTRATYPKSGGTASTIVIRRRDFKKSGNPGGVLETDSILCQISSNINSYALGFQDLLIQIDPPIKIPFFSEVRLEVAGSEAGYPYMDGMLGMIIY